MMLSLAAGVAVARRLVSFLGVVALVLSVPAYSTAQHKTRTTAYSGVVPLSTMSKPSALGPLVRHKSLSVLMAGGIAAAISWKTENAVTAADAVDGSLLGEFSDFGDIYGSGFTVGAGALGVVLAGHFSGNANLSATGVDLVRSLLSSGALVWALKIAVNRQRPSGGSYSFPSGHTAAAFALAPVLEKHYGWRLGVPAYALAVLTGAARIEDKRHYSSDVLFGAAIGIAAGYWAVGDHKPLKLLDGLIIDQRAVGVSFDF